MTNTTSFDSCLTKYTSAGALWSIAHRYDDKSKIFQSLQFGQNNSTQATKRCPFYKINYSDPKLLWSNSNKLTRRRCWCRKLLNQSAYSLDQNKCILTIAFTYIYQFTCSKSNHPTQQLLLTFLTPIVCLSNHTLISRFQIRFSIRSCITYRLKLTSPP